jgi:hypothetical protein
LEMMADSIPSQTSQTEVHPILCKPSSWEAWYSGIATCWDEYHIWMPAWFFIRSTSNRRVHAWRCSPNYCRKEL